MAAGSGSGTAGGAATETGSGAAATGSGAALVRSRLRTSMRRSSSIVLLMDRLAGSRVRAGSSLEESQSTAIRVENLVLS